MPPVAEKTTLQNPQIEYVRPFIGEELYLQFFIYRAVTGRTAILLEEGIKSGKVESWYNDSGIQQLLSYVMSSEEINQFKQVSVVRLHWLQNALEAKILNGMQRLIAGEVSSQESVEKAQNILKQVQTIRGTR